MSLEQDKLAMCVADRLAALAQDLESEGDRREDVILLGVAAGLLRDHAMDDARDSGSRAKRQDPEEGLGPKDGRAASEGGIAQGQCHD